MGKRGSTRRLRGAEREQYVRAALARWRSSGRSQADFCRSEGIAPITLIRWRREFGEGGPRVDPARFVRVDLGERRFGESFEVELPGGTRLTVPFGFDASDLARLLGVLDARRC